jgi:hypothetical protein
LITDVCRSTGHVLVEQPTGSGKTLEIVTLVAMQLGKRFSHAVIAAPQEQIEHGFVHPDYRLIAFPGSPGMATPDIEVPEGLIWGARQSHLGSVRRLLVYLRQPVPPDHALGCTHAALIRLSSEQLPDDLSGKALFVDEAHHASADGLSEVVSIWHERGGQLYFFTATPYRGDGRPVAIEGMRLYRRSLAEHMAEGFAPRHLESEIVALGQPGDTVTAAQFTGEEAPPGSYFEGLITAVCRRWSEDGKPKAIVRVPPMQGGRSGELVSRLMQALSSQGARVLDATGTGAADKQRFLSALEAEKGRTHATSAYDVMVGIQRVLEGTDWPVCSAVYCVGMPGSLNTVVQFLGRAMRLKGEDYPAAQRDRARLVFFVPCGGGAALADLSLDHSRHALLTCCFLADHEVGQEWIVLREVRRGIEAALGIPAENPAAADAENEAAEPLDPEVRAEVELVMANAREQIVSSGGEPTVGEVVQVAARTRPDLPEVALRRIATEILAAQTDSTGAAVREAFQQEIARRLRIDPTVKKAMAEAFALVLDEFRDVTLNDSAVLERVGRQVHGVTGGQMRDFARRLREASPKPLSVEQVLAWVDAFHEETGDWPKHNSGPIDDSCGETWSSIHNALMSGSRGLPRGSSLPRFLADYRGVRNHSDLPRLSVEQILGWADAHNDAHGRYPKLLSGSIEGTTEETWQGIHSALQKGLRGLPGGSSLARLLAEHRNVTNHKSLPKMSVTEILAWADAHNRRTGSWPRRQSGIAEEVSGIEWKHVDLALRKGLRGLPGGSSLATLLEAERGVRNRMRLPPLTTDLILRWADRFHERTGEWPTIGSGAVEDLQGETWRNIDAALKKGSRSLPRKMSLAQLLSEQRGATTPLNRPLLSEEQILVWIDAFYQRTGKWPTAHSGPVAEKIQETWSTIDQRLRKGGRGLCGGSSLAGLLQERRRVRREQRVSATPKKARPHERQKSRQVTSLTVEVILAWADAHHQETGKWPSQKTGQVFGEPAENWRDLDSALRRGRRGLPGDSSLARLLALHRSVANRHNLPRLTTEQILIWADDHSDRTGKWPRVASGTIHGGSGDTWHAINMALVKGLRGLIGGSSLAQLLHEKRGARNKQALPSLSIEQILTWADRHFEHLGNWPTRQSGSIPDATVSGETWESVNSALRVGLRGLPGGSSLARLIREARIGAPT